jgi:GT2 family glycosyltransferase
MTFPTNGNCATAENEPEPQRGGNMPPAINLQASEKPNMRAQKAARNKRSKPLVCAIVLTYNGKRHLEYCLPTLMAQDYPKESTIIAVVDNGGSDGSAEFVKENYPSMRLVRIKRNIGYTEGNNAGIAYAQATGAKYVFIFSDDLKISKNFISSIVSQGERNNGWGVFGCKIYYMGTDIIQAAGGSKLGTYKLNSTGHLASGEKDAGQFREPVELDCVYEAAFAVKSEVFDKVGLLDPAWYMNMEGPDFCTRAKKGGYATVFIPQASVQHEVGATTSIKKNKKMGILTAARYALVISKNGLRYLIKHESKEQIARSVIGSLNHALRHIISKPHVMALTLFAIGWNILYLPITLKLRNSAREDYEDRYAKFAELARRQ